MLINEFIYTDKLIRLYGSFLTPVFTGTSEYKEKLS